jgi:MFS family permease
MTAASRTRPGELLPWLLTAAFVEWLGTGLFLAVSAIFFVRVVGFTAAQVGLGMAIAGVAAMATTIPIGHLADRVGPRRVLIAMNLARAGATACYLAVDGWRSFLCVSVVVAVTEQAVPPLIQSLVGQVARADLRTRVMAAHRTVLNLGISAGGLIAGAVLGSGAHGAYQALFIADAGAFLAAAAVLTRVAAPHSTRSAPAGGRWAALRDRRLLALTMYDGVISLWQPILNIGFPLWLATRTHAAIGLVGVLYAVNTLTCVGLQFPIGSMVSTPHRALRSYALAAALLALACVVFAAAPTLGGIATIAAFVAAIATLTLAEITGVGAAWTLSFALAPDEQRGAYLSAFGLGRTVSTRVAGPLLMTSVVLALDTRGWLLLATLFALAAAVPLAVHLMSAKDFPCQGTENPSRSR